VLWMKDTYLQYHSQHYTGKHAGTGIQCELMLTSVFMLSLQLLNLQIFHTQQDTHLRQMKDIPTVQDCATYIGCMVPNFLGTEFRVMDFRKSLYIVALLIVKL
jgi:hypothetical protein